MDIPIETLRSPPCTVCVNKDQSEKECGEESWTKKDEDRKLGAERKTESERQRVRDKE